MKAVITPMVAWPRTTRMPPMQTMPTMVSGISASHTSPMVPWVRVASTCLRMTVWWPTA